LFALALRLKMHGKRASVGRFFPCVADSTAAQSFPPPPEQGGFGKE